jgi:hypothetical protein
MRTKSRRKLELDIVNLFNQRLFDLSRKSLESVLQELTKAGKNTKPTSLSESELIYKFMAKTIKGELEGATRLGLQGDAVAIEFLSRVALYSSKLLFALTQTQKTTVKALAQLEPFWPIPLGPYKHSIKTAKDLLNSLEVGSKSLWPINPGVLYSKRTDARALIVRFLPTMEKVRAAHASWTKMQSPATSSKRLSAFAMALLEDTVQPNWDRAQLRAHLTQVFLTGASLRPHSIGPGEVLLSVKDIEPIVNLCCRLPKLTPSKPTLKKWMQCLKLIVRALYAGHPEKNAGLRRIGAFLEQKNGARRGSGTADSNIREGIFRRIEETLTAVAYGTTKLNS